MTVRFLCIFPFIRVIAGIVFGTLLCVASSPVDAAKGAAAKAMVFSIVRASNPGCEPLCPEWIAAEGDITTETAKAFEAILKKVRGRKLPLLIHSFGGELGNAMRIGKLIRKNQMTVEVAKTSYVDCVPRDKKCKPKLGKYLYNGYASYSNAVCNSACTYVLAGGVRRIAGPSTRVGVHEIVDDKLRPIFSYKKPLLLDMITGKTICLDQNLETCAQIYKNRDSIVSRIEIYEYENTEQGLRKEIYINYFHSMGLNPEIFDFMLETDYNNIHDMTEYELFYYKLITEYPYDEKLVWLGICDGSKPPNNCISRKVK